MAWLQTSPDHGDKGQHPPRFKSIVKGSDYLVMPEADEYMIECWEMLGRCSSDGMSVSGISWTELDAFCRRSGRDLEPWQCDLLIKMSREYASFIHSEEAKRPDCEAPKLELLTDEQRLFVKRKEIDAQLRARRGRNKPA